MTLACYCGDGGDSDWYYTPPKDFSVLATKRRRRCCSCLELIDLGSEVGEFIRYRPSREDRDWIEERIYGDEVPIATWYMCEDCYGVYLSLMELKFCLMLEWGENIQELARLSAAIARGDYG